jgi:hypothetical protein
LGWPAGLIIDDVGDSLHGGLESFGAAGGSAQDEGSFLPWPGWHWHMAMTPRSGGPPASSSAARCSGAARCVNCARHPNQMTE